MTGHAPTRLELQLMPSADTPWIARRRLAEEFAAELNANELHDATLLISELVTNAVIHGRGRIELRALLDENRLTVDVTDQGGGFELPSHEPARDAVGGLGLHVVGLLASRWGVDHGTSHVWFELRRH